jgi:large subunit ribosomal protein L25
VLTEVLLSESGVNTLIGLSVDSEAAKQVLIKDYQVDPITHELLHVDFYRVAMDKVITVTVPIEVIGEPEGVKVQGGLVDFVQREIAIECLPSEIPGRLEVDVSSLVIGQGIRVRDLLEGVSWQAVTDPDTLIVHVIASKIEEEEETTEDEEEGTEEAAVSEDTPEESGGKSEG